MDEKLKLVTDFAELRAGMIVVVGPCPVCDGKHRGILTETNNDGYYDIEGRVSLGGDPVWRFLPRPVCSGAAHAVFSARAVERKKVHRVIDGLEDTQATRTEKPKRLVSSLPESPRG